jgi:hypothetical protein
MDGCAPGLRQASEPATAARRKASEKREAAINAGGEIAAECVARTHGVYRLDVETVRMKQLAVLHSDHAFGPERHDHGLPRLGMHLPQQVFPLVGPQSRLARQELELGLVGDDHVGEFR